MRIDVISAVFLAFVVYGSIPLADSEYTISYYFISGFIDESNI